jgi:predicted TPR repeat methyltransferase
VIAKLFGKKSTVIDWETTYSKGTYDGHADAYQWMRYAVISELIHSDNARSVLDIGCGYGLLRRFLPLDCAYTGLEISQVAVDGITDKRPADHFICADIQKWSPDAAYDAIVLSEVLYYCQEPRAVLFKLEQNLNPSGLLIGSFYNHPKSRSRNCEALRGTRQFLALDGFELLADLGVSTNLPKPVSWTILAGRKRDSSKI